jgi:Raf kinase inhibitor-like YbhB/YbcL family protein
VANIPANVSELPLDAGNPASGKMPGGAVTLRNDVGTNEYVGPCPPQGDHPHRYFFTIFAVGDELHVNEQTTPAVCGFQLHFNTLAKAEIVGLFKH